METACVNVVKFGETLTGNADGNPELSFEHILAPVCSGECMTVRTQ